MPSKDLENGPIIQEQVGSKMPSEPTTTTLWASGFNAFRQLFPERSEDVFDIRKLPYQDDDDEASGNLRLLFAGWSETAYYLTPTSPERFDGRLIRCGSTTCPVEHPQPVDNLESLGTPPSGKRRHITGVAVSGNGKVAVTFSSLKPTSDGLPETLNNGMLTDIVEFPLEPFRKWLQHASDADKVPGLAHTLSGRASQLVANATGFACLNQDGNVYTWGDARHGSLGRSSINDDSRMPRLVESLAGVKIKKIASGGWMTVALSEDNAAYVFGASTPGTKNTIECLRGLDPTEAALVDIEDGGEPLDVLDVAVGDGHVLLLVEGGRVFACGENQNGQLGLGEKDTEFIENWAEVKMPGGQRCRSVEAGSKSSFFRLEGE